MLYFGVFEGCLEGVGEVSGGCLSNFGYCLGGFDVQAIDNNPIRFIYFTVFPFLLVALDWSKRDIFQGVCRVSGRCLRDVWGCLSDSGYCLGGMKCKQLINTQSDSYTFASSFSPSCLGLFKMGGCLECVWKVSGRCLGGAWRLSE